MIVLDSSFLIAYHNQKDFHHQTALGLMKDFLDGKWGRGLLLEYVFLEVVTVLAVRRDVSLAQRSARILLDAQELEFVHCSDFFAESLEVFSAQTGTRLSFADAAIAAVARRRTGGLLLTFDEEFRKIDGIQALP